MTQLLGLLVSTLLTIILILLIYIFVIRRQNKGQAPINKIIVLLEFYYTAFINLLEGLSNGKNKWSYVYLFTLFNFIFINCLIPWIGFDSAATSIMFTFPLALITFIMIYVIGIGTMGFIKFCKHKYSNPMEIVLQFAPLLSMSIRLFAATLAGAIIGNVPWIIAQGIIGNEWYENSIALWFPIFQILFMWIWKIAETFLSLIQAFVFMTLTVIFWSMDTGTTWSRKERALEKQNQAHKLAIEHFDKINKKDKSTKVISKERLEK
ncbi:MAG: F0F1 ATP synthase subunit A [Mycoplasmataceae bacterium]|nr:F0F1 ATP synthase subunit A [Mycoplasmataceae bacterium]